MHDSCMSGRGSRAWWSTVNTITGRDTQPQSIRSVIHPDTINEYFCNINFDPEYIAPSLIDIPDDARIPEIPLHVVTQLLSKLKRTACGPDELPYWLFKEFAHDLAPVVTDVFNSSLRQHKVPSSWKMADIRPLPKESPLTCCTQLRPISLTAVIMRLFERLVYRFELSSICNDYINLDQFAYRGGHNSTMALIKCQHTWLKWLDSNADFVRIFSFDFSKAFDSVSHNILCSKLKQVNINPYIINWLISFLDQRKQRVVVDGYSTEYVSINRGVPQGTVLGPVLFSIFINDIKAVNTDKNLLVKFADDITVSLPIEASVGLDESETEVQSFIEWSEKNFMQVNLTKTWELLLRGKTTRTPPEPLEIIGRKEKLKLLGVTFEQVPVHWDTHIDYLLSKASSRLYILRICKYYGYTIANLDLLFQSLILSVFVYAIEVWGCAFYSKYLSRIDKLFGRCYKLGYCLKQHSILDIRRDRDMKLWRRISSTNTALSDLLPPQRTRQLRTRSHNYILPRVQTSRFKSVFINRCLFNSN